MGGAIDWRTVEARRLLEPLGARLGVPAEDLVQMAAGLEELNAKLLGPPSPRPLVRIPARLLRDASLGGALEVALRCVIEEQAVEVATEDLVEPARQLGLLSSVTRALEATGHLAWPRLCWDDSVPVATRTELGHVARNHCAAVVSATEEPTHVVCWEPDDDAASTEARSHGTLAVDEDRRLALVHWWYTPDSSDEWIALDRVRGLTLNEDWTRPLRRSASVGDRGKADPPLSQATRGVCAPASQS